MIRPRPGALLGALLALSACAAPAPQPRPAPVPPPAAASAVLDPVEERLVERAVDGDAVLLAGGERVRVLGIDAPEMKHPDPAVHALAEEARQELARAVEGRRVRVVVGMPQEPRDRFGRLLAYLELPEPNPDVGERLVAAGLARPYPSAHPRAELYRTRAAEARAAGRGLWQPAVAATLGLLGEPATVAEAPARVGERVRVTGTLRGTTRGDRVHRLILEDGGAGLELVIFPSRYDELPESLVGSWSGRRIAVTGEVSEHRGRAQVVLDDPFQVERIDAVP